MTRAANAPGAGTAVCKWQRQHEGPTEEEDGALLALGASSVSSDPVSFLMSSTMFLVVNSPGYARVRGRRDGRPVHTGFSFCDDDTTSLEDRFELVEVEVTVCGARSSACRYDGFFDGQLYDERLCDESDRVATYKHAGTSVFEKRSLSTKSAAPISRTLVSAYAMLTFFIFAFSPLAAEAILIAMTMGAERTSEFAKRRSSTAWRFPGDA